jgi:signal transduction histidine kinase/CheY-like chemotaxis protein
LVLAIESNEDRIEPIGQSGLADEVVTGICLTPSGRSFINNCIRQGAGLRHFDIVAESAVQPSLEIFSGFKHVYCMPLYFKAQPVGVMIFLNDEPEPNWRLHVSLGPLLADLLGAIIYGLGNEKEKAARYDKARILQETSLAISSTLDLPSVLQVVATRLTDYAGATYCTIILNSDAENVMEVATFHTRRQGGAHPPEARRINLVEFPRLAEAMSANRIMILGAQEMGELTPSEKRFLKIDAIKQLLIVPVSHSAKSIGVVVLGEERAKSRSSVGSDRLNFVQAVISQAASAIENARLYGYINQRVDQLTALYSVSAAIHSEINVNTMLEKVLATTGEFLHYTSAAIFPVDENHKIQNPMAASGVDQEQSTDGMLTVFSATAAQVVASTGGSLIVEDMRVESDFHPTFHKTLSELSVPIKIAERVIGVFSVGSNRAWVYSAADESFLKALAGQIAVALERARLFEQERERSLKLRTIFEFSKKLSKSLNVSEVLKIAATSIREAFAYQLVAVFMADEKAGRFIIGHQSSATDKKLPDDFFVPLDEGLLGRALRSRKTVYSPNVTSEPDYVVAVGDVRSEICIPIMVADRVMGVLDVESMELDTFSQEDIDTLEAMADIMSVAIDNSFLFEETIEKAERLSLIDNINRAISATLDLDSFFRVVARAVADNAGYRWTALAVPEDGAFVFKAGYSPKSAGIISTENMLFMLQSHLETVIRTARPEFVTFSQMANSGAREKLHSIIDAGIRSLAIFPIGDSTRAEAVMIVGSACSDGFREQEVTLLKDLAVHLRIAWQNAQLYMELRTAYEQLQEAQDRVIQTEKLRALGEMSSGVVHDFNNVLAAILGRLQIVLRKLSDFGDWSGTQFIRRNLELMEKAANDGSHILSRINEFTKKKPSEKFVDLHVDQIIADTIELTRPRWHDQARLAGKSIEVDFHHFGHQVTAGSPPELREVFTNLIINAVDAIEGVGKITITSSGRPGETIIITVEDTGRGMTAETRNKIFEPFFTTKGAGGTGLGLSVTYGIISRHKGSIDVETELGRGTKFIITLPVREAGQEETRHVKIDASNVTCGRILIVDDEDQFRDIISEILTSAGHTVHSAANGRQALEMMTQKEYDVVITDLGMAGLSGWELADAIHRDHPSARIIIATGWGANLDRESLTAHHIHGLINKPFKIEELIGAVDEALGGVKKGAPVGWK